MYQTDLFFQIWLSNIERLHSLKGYNQRLLVEAYNNGLKPEEFYINHIYLPF